MCHPSSTRNVEMIIASAGIIWITRISTISDLRDRNWNRDSASAARNAKSSATTSVISVTETDTLSAGTKPSFQAAVKLRSVNSSGQRCTVSDLTAEPGRNDVLTIQ